MKASIGFKFVPESEIRPGLFEEPLVTEGKRQRKPSNKLIMKLSDDWSQDVLEKRRKIEVCVIPELHVGLKTVLVSSSQVCPRSK